MGMIMKIYALVAENDYYKFRAKCSRQKRDFGEALSAMVHQQANNPTLEIPKGNGRRPAIKEEIVENQEEKKE